MSGSFNPAEEELYLKLLNEVGKPIVKNPHALKVFAAAFPTRIIRSIQSHVSSFENDPNTNTWYIKS